MKTWIVLFFLCLINHSNASTTLITDQDYFSALLKELDQAKTSIDVLSFSFAIDNGKGQIQTSNQAFLIAKKLAELKKEKGNALQIRLYIEAKRNTVNRNKITADFLEKAGVILRYGSTHAKGFSIDHKRILFGSTNLTVQSMTKNNETNIVTDDLLIVKGFDNFFQNLWDGKKQGSITLEKPMLADGTYKDTILNAIKSSKHSLDFSIYYFNDTDIETELIKASARGIVVRGYLNQREIPGGALVIKNKQTIDRMKKAGITKLYLALDSSFTHSKYIICDQETILLGTGNWNYSDVNNYRQLYLELHDNRLATELSKHLDEQIKLESMP